MAPHVPHFSISLATSPRALSLPSSPPLHARVFAPCCYSLRHRRSFGHLPADIGTTAEFPINNVLLNYRPGCAAQVSFRRFRRLSSWEIKCNLKAFTVVGFHSLLTHVCKTRVPRSVQSFFPYVVPREIHRDSDQNFSFFVAFFVSFRR